MRSIKIFRFIVLSMVISVYGVENVNNQMFTGKLENSSGHLENPIQDKETICLKAEEDSAYLWVKVGSEQARFIRKETQKLPIMDLLISIADSQKNMEKLTQYQTRKHEHMTNIKNTLSSYSDSIQQISTLSSQSVKKGFVRYLNFLMSRNDGEQIQILNKLQKHVEEYQKNRQVNLEKWKKEIIFVLK